MNTFSNLTKELGDPSTWNFEKSPHLFPLYLYLHFVKKYGDENQSLNWRNNFPEKDSVLCMCKGLSLPINYKAGLALSAPTESIVTFSFIINKGTLTEVDTFMNPKENYLTISVNNYKESPPGIGFLTETKDVGEGFKILGLLNTVGEEIIAKLKSIGPKVYHVEEVLQLS